MKMEQAKKELEKLHPSYKKAFLEAIRRAMAITDALKPTEIQDPDRAANLLGSLVLRKKYLAQAAEIFETGHVRGYHSHIEELQELRRICEKQLATAEELLACLAARKEDEK